MDRPGPNEASGRGAEESGRGRSAEKPSQITRKGWRDILLRTKEQIETDNISIIAAGVAFYLLLGSIPSLAAMISIYGMVADPNDLQSHFIGLASVMPGDAVALIEEQMTRIASSAGTAGWGAVLGILLALWTGSKGMGALIRALNIAYDESETRGFFKLTLLSLAFTFGLVIAGILSVTMVIILPALLDGVGLGGAGANIIAWVRWPLLFVLATLGLAVLYRFGPDRDKPQWRWVTWGSAAATLLWVAGSALFSIYVSNFSDYNKTYGSLGAVIILLMWFYLSTFVVLLGAELNSEMEHQTAQDTTEGPPKPMGAREAHVADTLGEAK